MSHRNQHPFSLQSTALIAVTMIMLAGCSKQAAEPQPEESVKVSAGRIGVIVTDFMVNKAVLENAPRTASLLGIFVSKYLSETHVALVGGALRGIDTQAIILLRQGSVGDPDFELLQAFADILQVDVQDLLNRSLNRQEALDAYANALTNVASRANTRYKDLKTGLESVDDDVRQKNRERSDLERQLNRAIDDKEFTLASEIQKQLSAKEKEYSDANLMKQQLESVTETLDQLLSLFGERILAIQRNREALIAGTMVFDMPGIDDLKLIKKNPTRRRSGTDDDYDDVFESLGQPQSQQRSGSGASSSRAQLPQI